MKNKRLWSRFANLDEQWEFALDSQSWDRKFGGPNDG